MADKKMIGGAWAVGGGLLAGLGCGFFFLQTSALGFVGCICAGLGFGLLAAPVLSKLCS